MSDYEFSTFTSPIFVTMKKNKKKTGHTSPIKMTVTKQDDIWSSAAKAKT